MSFKTQILNLNVTVSDVSSGESPDETYINGEQWQTTVKTKTDIVSFSNGLLDSGEYILITSGGAVAI